jgi:DNA-binding CsgD family transcriptional regulator
VRNGIAWLRHLSEGRTVADLADSVGYSERMMYRLLANLYRRLGARSRTKALMLAQREGWL